MLELYKLSNRLNLNTAKIPNFDQKKKNFLDSYLCSEKPSSVSLNSQPSALNDIVIKTLFYKPKHLKRHIETEIELLNKNYSKTKF
jgi:hypothetical protein